MAVNVTLSCVKMAQICQYAGKNDSKCDSFMPRSDSKKFSSDFSKAKYNFFIH